MGSVDGVEEEQVRSAIVILLCELTLMDSIAGSLEHTQKCYQRYLEPQTLRRGTTYEKFASDLHRKFQRTNLASNVLVAASILF